MLWGLVTAGGAKFSQEVTVLLILLDLYPEEFGPFCCAFNAVLGFKLSSSTKAVICFFKEIIVKVIHLFQISTGSTSNNSFCCSHLWPLKQTELLKNEKEREKTNSERVFPLMVCCYSLFFNASIILSPLHSRSRTCSGQKCSLLSVASFLVFIPQSSGLNDLWAGQVPKQNMCRLKAAKKILESHWEALRGFVLFCFVCVCIYIFTCLFYVSFEAQKH